jgi:hypothetical protein
MVVVRGGIQPALSIGNAFEQQVRVLVVASGTAKSNLSLLYHLINEHTSAAAVLRLAQDDFSKANVQEAYHSINSVHICSLYVTGT